MAGKIDQLGIEFRISPVGLEHGRFQIVQIDGQGPAAKMAERIFQAAQEGLSVLPEHRFTVSLAGVTQNHAENPRLGFLAVGSEQGRARPKIDLHFLPWLDFDPLHQPGISLAHLVNVTFDRLIRTGKRVFQTQILIDPLRRQTCVHFLQDQFSMDETEALPPRFSGGQKRVNFNFHPVGAGGRKWVSLSFRPAGAGGRKWVNLSFRPAGAGGRKWVNLNSDAGGRKTGRFQNRSRDRSRIGRLQSPHVVADRVAADLQLPGDPANPPAQPG